MAKPGILIVGPIFDTASGPSGVGGKLYQQFLKENLSVLKCSSVRNKIGRFADIVYTLFRYRNQYDIILLQGFGLLAFVMEDAVSRIAKMLNKPVIYTIHGGAFNEFYERHTKWCQKVLSRMTVINTPSKFLQSFLDREGHKAEYVPNFINLEHFHFYNNIRKPHSILWVRAFHDIYHPELAIEAIDIIKEKVPDVQLTMIGPDQGSKNKCENLIQTKQLGKYITLLGVISNHKLSQYYCSHAVYINTTRYESFGVALIEAGACGIPIVSTEVGEIPFIWTNQNSILFADRNPQDFAEKIIQLFDDPLLCDKLRINARKIAEKFTWEKVHSYWFQKIQELTK